MIVLVLVALGLLLGSFANALIWRLHEHRNWVSERSECPHCHHVLAPKDLVPVLSWVLLRGKCRYCKARIPDSPLVEITMPILFVASYAWWPQPLSGQGMFDFIVWLIFVVGFVVLAVYDLRWFLLPNMVVFPLIALAGLQLIVDVLVYGAGWQSLVGPALGVAVISGSFYAIYGLSKGKWIGFGDVKLGVVLGLLAGGVAESAVLLFVASLLGTLIALPLIAAGKAHRKSLLPFGPLLLAAMFVIELWGAAIVNWYTGLIL